MKEKKKQVQSIDDSAPYTNFVQTEKFKFLSINSNSIEFSNYPQ